MKRENILIDKDLKTTVNLIDDSKFIKGQGNCVYNKKYYFVSGEEIFDKFTNKFVDYKL